MDGEHRNFRRSRNLRAWFLCLGFFASEFRELSAALFEARTADETGDEEGVLSLETTDGLAVE